MNRKKLIVLLLGSALLAVLLWLRPLPVSNPTWEQPTMGTLCHITLTGSISKRELTGLRSRIDDVLDSVNRRMSTWQADTEISRFNRQQSTEPFPISDEFAAVVQNALSFSRLTGGAFDPTVKPLVDYWGFGPGSDRQPLEQIIQAVGWQKVTLENNALVKASPQLQIDLSAIAKGFGVDEVAGVIRDAGRQDFLVEIGGEIVAEGLSPSGRAWRVGIESPEPGKAFGTDIFRVIELSGQAMATSGDYRNFQVREDGSRYSHIIDPRTGRPAQSDVAAVTVLAGCCMDADAVATALFVMGSERALQWLGLHPEFQAFLILHAEDGGFQTAHTPAFPALSN